MKKEIPKRIEIMIEHQGCMKCLDVQQETAKQIFEDIKDNFAVVKFPNTKNEIKRIIMMGYELKELKKKWVK